MIRKLLGILLAATLAISGVAATFVAEQTSAEAADASKFDPGLIISDSVFYDFGAMTAAEIQRFLESKLPKCNDADGGPKCIKDYVADTPSEPGEDGWCKPATAKQNQTAAQIIYAVAQLCGINPRVILVKLQKEQGLITLDNPSAAKYEKATGYRCPDTAPCDPKYANFFSQLYYGAGQLQWYGDSRGSFTYLRVGREITIRHQDKGIETRNGINCGSKTFLLKSQATAALYYYTPYTPNAAALNNLYGTGDTCSAYGNRNFWRLYSDWFGSPIGGGFLLKGKSGDTYFIIEGARYKITEPDLVAALKPLGPLGLVSQQYIDSFTDAGNMGRLLKSPAGNYYLADAGKRFKFTNCSQVTVFGLDCANAIPVTASQITMLGNGNAVTEYISGDDGQTFLIENGTKRQVLDTESLIESRIGIPAKSSLKVSALKSLPWGNPIIRRGASFINLATKKLAVYDGTNYYDVDTATLADIDLTAWFPKSTGSMLGEALAPAASTVKLKSIVNSPSGTQYLITKLGKRKVVNSKVIAKNAPVISDDLLSLIPDAPTNIEATLFVKAASSKNIYLVANGVKRPLVVYSDAAKFASGMKSIKVETLSNSAFAQIPTSSPAIAPGTYVKLGTAGYMVDGLSRALVVSNSSQAALLGLGSARAVTATQLKGYNKTVKASGIKFVCGENYFIAITGKLYPISAVDASHYPGRGLTLDAMTCAVMPKSATMLGRFVKTVDKKYYLIEGQTKQLIRSATAYEALRGAGAKAVLVGPYFLSKIITGKAAGATMNTDAFDVGAPIVPADTVSSPSVSPSPSISASPSPSATNTLPSGVLIYTATTSDKTLTGICSKLGVSLSATVTLNKSLNPSFTDIVYAGKKFYYKK